MSIEALGVIVGSLGILIAFCSLVISYLSYGRSGRAEKSAAETQERQFELQAEQNQLQAEQAQHAARLNGITAELKDATVERARIAAEQLKLQQRMAEGPRLVYPQQKLDRAKLELHPRALEDGRWTFRLVNKGRGRALRVRVSFQDAATALNQALEPLNPESGVGPSEEFTVTTTIPEAAAGPASACVEWEDLDGKHHEAEYHMTL